MRILTTCVITCLQMLRLETLYCSDRISLPETLMHALRYLLPLAAFFLGVYLTEWIKHFYKTSVKIHWRQIVLIIEILILGITGFLRMNLPSM